MLLEDIKTSVKPKSASFLFFLYSSLYLENYLCLVFNTEDIESFEKEIHSKGDHKKLSEIHKAYMLTGTMLVNRTFTLIDSFFNSLAYEMELLSKSYFVYKPYSKGDPVKAVYHYPGSNSLRYNRLLVDGEEFKFNYKEEYKELITIYLSYYNKIRNPNTHNASGSTPFLDILKSLCLSASSFDISFHSAWNDNVELSENINKDIYEYFLEITKASLPQALNLISRTPPENLLKEYQSIIEKAGLENLEEYNKVYDSFFKFVGGTQFNPLFI